MMWANPKKLIRRALDLSDKEKYTGAIKLLTRAIAAEPGNAQAYHERAMALMNLDRDAEAAADFGRALALDADFPGARDWRARAYESLGNHQAAAEDRLEDVRRHPEGPHEGMGVCPQNWAECAGSFIKAGQPAKARELLEEYFREYAAKVTLYAPVETAPMRMLAEILMASADFERACELAQRACRSEHRCPADLLVYALALEAAGDLATARGLCAEAMKANEHMPGVRELSVRLAE